MTILEILGAAIGRKIASEIDYDKIVRTAMASEFERLAEKPEYAHASERLRRWADSTRKEAKASAVSDDR